MEDNVSAFLRKLRAGVPGCHAIALADLDANMVLTEDSGFPVGQELWEALTIKAIEMLVGQQAHTLAETLTDAQDDFVRYAKLRHENEVFLLVRSQAEPPLGLLLICDTRTDPDIVVHTAREELEALASTN